MSDLFDPEMNSAFVGSAFLYGQHLYGQQAREHTAGKSKREEAGPRTRVRVHSEESGRVPVELQRRTLARVFHRIRDVVGVERPHELVPLFQVRHRLRLRFVVDIPAII